MISQGEAVRKLQGIIISGPEPMSKAEVILATVDSPSQLKDVTEEKLAKYTAIYNEYMAMDEQVEMTGEMAVEITDEAKARLKEVLREIEGADDLFERMMESIEEFFFNPPFEGFDDLPYGLIEISTFAYLEYFASKVLGLNHDEYREMYRKSIAERSYEENANVHMEKNYDPVQGYFGKAISKAGAENELDYQMAICGILALTNIKTPEMVGLIVDGAIDQANELVMDIRDDIYVEGMNSLHDNVYKLIIFTNETLAGIKESME